MVNNKWDKLLETYVQLIKLDTEIISTDPEGYCTPLYDAINSVGFKLQQTKNITLSNAKMKGAKTSIVRGKGVAKDAVLMMR